MARFALGPRVRGAHAIDVGASTGGFTDVMLREGAARVTAIDVGHGQLLPRLRDDARVESLERTDFKTLALGTAPGPFAFFTVDVSFVAARSMLRGLAFRLRAGAEGVVLVKPQFEVPRHLVKGGDVGDQALRARAVATFRDKAEALGFELVELVDSPVAGGEGTVEILAHLRFRGRTTKLPPRPGEEREPEVAAPAETRPRAPGRERRLAGKQRWFAMAAPGLEGVLLAEVQRLPGLVAATQVPGGVELEGDLRVGMAANLRLRTASRVLLRLGSVRAREFSKLRRLAEKLSPAWQCFVDGKQPVRFEVTARASRLYHTGAVADTLALAIEDRIGRKVKVAKPSAVDEAEDAEAVVPLRVYARGENDQWMFSVDASGELLHRRGWRLEAGEAPLRETLAAGLLALAGYDPARPLVDLMCGAGTIVIEAACQARGLDAGQGRSFGFQRWPAFDAEAWQAVQAAARPVPAAANLFGLDRDPEMIALATRNAERAGVAELITFAVSELRGEGNVDLGSAPGLVMVNPPYGRRLGQPGEAARLVRVLGQELKRRFAGWTAGVLLAHPSWVRSLGVPARATHTLSNGGVKVTFAIVDVPAARGRV